MTRAFSPVSVFCLLSLVSCLLSHVALAHSRTLASFVFRLPVHPESLVGEPAVVKAYDLKTVTLEELKAPLVSDFRMRLNAEGPVEGFCGWFDTDFHGSEEMPVAWPSTLSTAPDETGATHWGQQLFQVSPNLRGKAGDEIRCDFEMRRRKDNQRLLEIDMRYGVVGSGEGEARVRYVIE